MKIKVFIFIFTTGISIIENIVIDCWLIYNMKIDSLSANEYKQQIDEKEVPDKELLFQYMDRLAENGMPIIFDIEHLAILLKLEYRQLLAYIFAAQRAYHSIEIPKRTEGTRILEIPTQQLKMIQSAILRDILEKIRVSGYATAFIKGKSIVDNARCHMGKEYVVTFDLKDFFTTIEYGRVFHIFYYYGYTKEVSFALASLVTKDGYLPQGSPASPYISNIVCLKLDKRLGRLAEKIGCSYSRYADDITFSGNRELLTYIGVIQKIIREEGFTVNDKKTRVQSRYYRQEVTGIIVNHNMRVDKKYKQYLRQQIYYCSKYGVDSHLKRIHCDFSGYKDHLYGIAYFIKMVEREEGEKWLEKLDEINWFY